MMPTRRLAVWSGGALLLAAAGCHHHRGSASAETACAPVVEALATDADVRQLAGTFDVSLRPVSGPRAGAAPATARLVFQEQDAALAVLDTAARVSQPVIGTMAVAHAALGAIAMGDPVATDPRRPGVAAYATRAPDGRLTSLVIRIGATSNERDVMPYDAGHFTLYVRRVAADGFAGGWSSSSGAGMNPVEASGHFCAVRVGG